MALKVSVNKIVISIFPCYKILFLPYRLDNALANAAPFAGETEACKRPVEAAAIVDANAEADTEASADNGVENSDSDSEDLGPETAVDADDIDADARNHEPAPLTLPVHAGMFFVLILVGYITKSKKLASTCYRMIQSRERGKS